MPALVDHDHRVGNGIEDRLQMGLAVPRIFQFLQKSVADEPEYRPQHRKAQNID